MPEPQSPSAQPQSKNGPTDVQSVGKVRRASPRLAWGHSFFVFVFSEKSSRMPTTVLELKIPTFSQPKLENSHILWNFRR